MFTTFVTSFLIVLLLIVILIYKTLFAPYNYWKTKGICGPKPIPIFGNYAPVMFGFKTEAELLREFYERYSSDFIGIYKGFDRVLLIKNPETIKQVLLKDFDNFNERCIEKSLEEFKYSIFVMKGGEDWKIWRRIFSPGMLSDKINKMIPIVNTCLDNHLKTISNILDSGSTVILSNVQEQFVLDVFKKLIFNKDSDDLSKTPDDITTFIKSKLEISFSQQLQYISGKMFESHNEKCLLGKYVSNIIDEIENNGAKRNNLMEFMVGMKMNGKTRKDKELPLNIDNDVIIQQSLTFFLTAFVSTSNVMAFVLQELSNNERIQEKCYEEITKTFNNNNEELTTEAISNLKYIQMVIDETMRKHTVAQVIDRKSVGKYTFPDIDITIDENVSVFVPVHGLHYDDRYFSNPEVFDPERFSDGNKNKINQYVYLPFGDGPRMCIGLRLAKIVMIIGLTGFLRRYKVKSRSGTEKTIKYDPKRIRFLSPVDTWLNIERRI